MVPEIEKVRTVIQDMCDRAADIGVSHAEEELGLQAKTFSREKQSLWPLADKVLTDYSKDRSFWITGIIKDDVLREARGFLLDFVKENPSRVIDERFDQAFLDRMKPWLPELDTAGRMVNKAFRAETIVRTNVMDMYNHARLQMFTAPGLDRWVLAFRYSAIMDSRTTPICRELHGRIFKKGEIKGFLPPNHFNCRSTLIPITQLDRGWEKKWEKQPPITIRPADGFGGTGLPQMKGGKKGPVLLKDLLRVDIDFDWTPVAEGGQKPPADKAVAQLRRKGIKAEIDTAADVNLINEAAASLTRLSREVLPGKKVVTKIATENDLAGTSAYAEAVLGKGKINLNPDYLIEVEDLARSFLETIETKTHPPTTASAMRTIIEHEYAHHVKEWMAEATGSFFPWEDDINSNVKSGGGGLGRVDKALERLDRMAKEEERSKTISYYAVVNEHETFAEGFTLWRLNPETVWSRSRYARAQRDVIELLNKGYTEQPQFMSKIETKAEYVKATKKMNALRRMLALEEVEYPTWEELR